MNRRQFIQSATAAFAAAGSVPAYAAPRRSTLNIFCWSEYIPQSVVERFAKAENAKVNVENYASNEEMMAKLQAGTSRYDLIQPSEYFVEELIKDGKVETLDLGAIPNFKNLDPRYTGLPHDPENKYTVTWMAGNVGVCVNRDRVKDQINSYHDVFQEKFKKRIVVLDDNREMVAWALASLGLDVNDVTEANLAKVAEVLGKWLPLVKLYDSDSPKTALLNGDCDIGIIWNGEGAKILQEQKRSKKRKLNFEYLLPPEGAHMFIDSLAIPKGARNKEMAHKFINYVLDPEISVEVWTDFPYTMVNAEGRKLLSPEQLANAASFPPAAPKLSTFKAIPKSMSAAIDKMVTDLKNQ